MGRAVSEQNIQMELEIAVLVREKSEKQSLKDIFKYVAKKYNVNEKAVENRYQRRVKKNMAQLLELAGGQLQAAATSALTLVVDNTKGEGATLRVAIPPKAGTVEDSTVDATPISVKMAQKVAKNFEDLYNRNAQLEAQVKELEAKLDGSVSKDEHDAVRRQLRSVVEEKVELENTLSGIVKFQESRKYTVDRQGQVKLQD